MHDLQLMSFRMVTRLQLHLFQPSYFSPLQAPCDFQRACTWTASRPGPAAVVADANSSSKCEGHGPSSPRESSDTVERELRAVSTARSCTVCNTKLRRGAAAQPGSCPRRASDLITAKPDSAGQPAGAIINSNSRPAAPRRRMLPQRAEQAATACTTCSTLCACEAGNVSPLHQHCKAPAAVSIPRFQQAVRGSPSGSLAHQGMACCLPAVAACMARPARPQKLAIPKAKAGLHASRNTASPCCVSARRLNADTRPALGAAASRPRPPRPRRAPSRPHRPAGPCQLPPTPRRQHATGPGPPIRRPPTHPRSTRPQTARALRCDEARCWEARWCGVVRRGVGQRAGAVRCGEAWCWAARWCGMDCRSAVVQYGAAQCGVVRALKRASAVRCGAAQCWGQRGVGGSEVWGQQGLHPLDNGHGVTNSQKSKASTLIRNDANGSKPAQNALGACTYH
eukprot:363231-Chlamydomonas_euryale.AAC.2